ncbi:hypothetical protein GCM10011581_39530 [Saccharopolyspora subtropica]|uniref:lysozyme n=1 Tax=Saccharopolyspora thermophila TaxID=89367 RepID=A0A917NGD3_9PSEU|nr:lysozyme [Saccharopolyspora subtropica]GGI98460.1 hypothetical protein GCM10011581_39530 [Saccharopolyspora subtropica]
MNPESSDQPRSPEHNDLASTPTEATERGWRGAALKADQALRTAADRVRPVANRVGQWLLPLVQRLLMWLAPLVRRIQNVPVVWRFGERMASRAAAAKVPTRTRSMQAGAAFAAVGVVGLVIGSVVAGSEEPDVATAAPAQVAPEEATPAQAAAAQPEQQPTPAQQPAPEQQPAPAPLPEPEAPIGPPVQGIDVSNHNGNIDWSKVAADGKKFTFVLATDGTSFTNPRYSQQYHGAKDAGLIAGAYHFARPSSSSAEVQAQRFLDVADYQADGRTLPPVLDLEIDPNTGGCYGLSVAEMHQWTKTFADKVKERTGKDAIIYANPSFWRQCMGGTDSFGHHALWLASYGVDSPTVPTGFDGWDFWQYTDKGRVAGISGYTDLNLYQEGIERLRRLAR